MSGYSGTPLVRKLGLKPGHRVALVNAPAGFEQLLDGLPDDVRLARGVPRSPAQVIIWFVTSRAELIRRLAAVAGQMTQDGAIWIAWPKKAGRVPTDMTEDVIREVALPTGLVDNKVCAIDHTWSALRLVIRKELRAKKT